MPLSLRGLSHSFDGSIRVLSEINFESSKESIIKITGENGVGKTTLLRILATHLFPTHGELLFEGENIFLNSLSYRKKLSWLHSEGGAPFLRLTGKENLRLFFTYRRGIRKFTDILNLWSELPSFQKALETPFYMCSSGMKQIIGLCRCLESSASIYLLDEPTRHLDSKAQNFIENCILEVTKNSIAVIATHNSDFLVHHGCQYRLVDGKLLD